MGLSFIISGNVRFISKTKTKPHTRTKYTKLFSVGGGDPITLRTCWSGTQTRALVPQHGAAGGRGWAPALPGSGSHRRPKACLPVSATGARMPRESAHRGGRRAEPRPGAGHARGPWAVEPVPGHRRPRPRRPLSPGRAGGCWRPERPWRALGPERGRPRGPDAWPSHTEDAPDPILSGDRRSPVQRLLRQQRHVAQARTNHTYRNRKPSLCPSARPLLRSLVLGAEVSGRRRS